MNPRAKKHGLLLCVVLAGLLTAGRCGSSSSDETTPDTSTVASSDSTIAQADRSRIQGSPSAPVWIVEISDFQCPFCAQWHSSSYEEIKRDYVDTGKARFAYVNFPLPTHKNAWPAAEAALCAGLQGKFWSMHDAIFKAQSAWSGVGNPATVFDSLATGADVNVRAMRECIASGGIRPLIQADLDRSTDSGVSSTPTFLVGGVALVGAQPTSEFRRVLDSLLKK